MKKICFSVLIFQVIIFSACTDTREKDSCVNKIDQLSNQQGIHLIYYCYYNETGYLLSGADTILEDLTYYRDKTDSRSVIEKDNMIISNLKKAVCSKDTMLIAEMERWCETSRNISKIRSEVDFTIEGYMEFLNDFESTRSVITPYIKDNRTIYSLSSSEMERIYFSAISTVSLLKKEEQSQFFERLKAWDFK